MKKLFYFGCIGQKGHYLFGGSEREAAKALHLSDAFIRSIDGKFTPTETTEQGLYRLSVIGICQIVSWHDYSVDQRPGSNSILLGIGFNDAEEMLSEAEKLFPEVMKRQKRPTPLIHD